MRLLAAFLCVLSASCGSAAATKIAVLPGPTSASVPSQIMGLVAREEPVEDRFAIAKKRAFITGVKLWSLREGERVRATVQVARFASDAKIDDEEFQASVINQIGSAAPKAKKIDGQTVWISPGNLQTLATYFKDSWLVVLSVSTDYPADLALIRRVVAEVNPS